MLVPILIGIAIIGVCAVWAIIDGARYDKASDQAWEQASYGDNARIPLEFPRFPPSGGSAAGASAKVPGGVDVRTSHDVNVARKA